MTDNFEMFFNGRKVEFPFDMNEVFSQLDAKKITPSQQFFNHSLFPERQIIVCKDTPAREAITDMNKRIIKIEELLKLRKKIPIKKTISNIKETSKTKGDLKKKPIVKEKKKSKVIRNKIGKKK